ncbi:FAD-dependent oxidoreductase [Actinokineospora iranica]|uniref:Assimilatory nitrate reductase electron transfer subunit n=1 Tax=Actinokineospora iranica TaxID=1271860 RepID=A0A1G6IN07_9PSEU|nr:FAD-dependent oxidoreductase [Actinokineospora iranica]SDC07854.1 assimilatory nitrate reductase electron transfer subunit [Actinokineospora iranica]
MSDVLVIGSGPTLQRFADRMRHHAHPGSLTVLETDPPALSPAFGPVVGGGGAGLRAEVVGVDRERRRVSARVDAVETTYPYDVLVLAGGTRPVVPGIPGLLDARGRLVDGVVAPSAVTDAARVTGGTVVVLGDAPLGVEVASALTARGVDTTLVCAEPRPLLGRLGEICASLLSEWLERTGVTVVGGANAVRRAPGRLVLDNGTTLRADTLVLCAGAVPDTRLGLAAGLIVHSGIVVDDQLRASDPRVHAIGDCAEHDGRTVPGADAAWAQAEVLARVLTGQAAAYRPPPPALRLRVPGADVAGFGSPADLEQPGTRLISVTDPAGGRHARVALRDERVVAAVLFGLPQAIATIGFLHRHGRCFPSDRLGLLLGLPPRPASHARETSVDSQVCLCNNVSMGTLRQAWRTGSRTAGALATVTRATTGCGGCSQSVADLCRVWASESGDRLVAAS